MVETVRWRKPSDPGGVPVWELDEDGSERLVSAAATHHRGG